MQHSSRHTHWKLRTLSTNKDTASYERLLDLTKFCEQWSQSVTRGVSEDQWDENLDSDDEKFDATAPVPRRLRVAAIENSDLEGKGDDDVDEDQEMSDVMEPSPADQTGDIAEPEDDVVDDGAAPLQSAKEKLYLPEQILERETHIVYKKTRGRYGGRSKKASNWQERILVKWKGYSSAESTWETDIAYYQKWNSALVAARDESEIPETLLKRTKHPVTKDPFYQVKWQGSSSHTMEAAGKVEQSERFVDALQRFNDKSGNRGGSPARGHSSNSSNSSGSSSMSSCSSSSSSSGGRTTGSIGERGTTGASLSKLR
jgi:hypothetical protein